MSKPIKKKKQNREPSVRAKLAFKKSLENGGNVSKAMRESGYGPGTSKNPKKLTSTESWKQLMERYLPDGLLAKTHNELLTSHRMDHMVFPLGPDEGDEFGDEEMDPEEDGGGADRTSMTDKEITEMLAELGCKVRKIVHGNTARHVYFWSPDNMTRDKAIDKAYKLKGTYASEKLDVTTKGSIIYLPGKSKKDA